MKTSTLMGAAALLGAVILTMTLGGQSAFAQGCPYFTGRQIDNWFLETTQFGNEAEQKLLCVDDPGFVTFDFLDRSAPRSIYLDVTYGTSHTDPEYKVEAAPTTTNITKAGGVLTSQEASACRKQIVTSRAWSALGCPNN